MHTSPPTVTPQWHHSFDSYDDYETCTASRNWAGIFAINGRRMDSFGTRKELKVLPEYLEQNEVVFALASGIMKQTETSNSFDFGANTWLVVLTSERFLFLDHAMLTKSVDTQSVRLDHAQAVSASQGMMFGKITIDLGSRTIVIDNCRKGDVKVMANLANRWIRLREEQSRQYGQPVAPQPPTDNGQHEQLLKMHIKLASAQLKNQERIITLLEQIHTRIMER